MLAFRTRALVAQVLRPSAPARLSRHVSSPPCLRGFYRPTPAASIRLALLELPSRRCFTSSAPSLSSASSSQSASSSATVSEHKPKEVKSTESKSSSPTKSIWSRLLPSNAQESGKSASSFRKIVALARPEKKPLGIAIGLLMVSSAVSMSVPFTIGKLIDYFSSTNPVSPPIPD